MGFSRITYNNDKLSQMKKTKKVIQKPKIESRSNRSKIVSILKKYGKAVSKGDFDTSSKFLHDEVALVYSKNAPLLGKAQIEKLQNKGYNHGYKYLKFQTNSTFDIQENEIWSKGKYWYGLDEHQYATGTHTLIFEKEKDG